MNPETGGVCKAVRDIIDGIKKLEPHVINEVVSLDQKDSLFLEKDDFKTFTLGRGKTPWRYNKKLQFWLEKNIPKYDLLIVHGLWQFQSYAVLKSIKNRRKNFYVMPHGMLDPYFQKGKGRKIKAIRNLFFWHFIERKLINQARGILFTCIEEKLLARKSFPKYRPNTEKVVGLGLRKPPPFDKTMTDEFIKKVPEWNGKPFWLFLGRIHPKKGIDLTIKAYLELSKRNKNLPQLVIVGPGEKTLYGVKLKETAKLSSNILFPGMLSHKARWGAFYNSEIFILNSHQENFGLAVVEAIACNVPVLISNKVNIWREIDKDQAGMVEDDSLKGSFNLLQRWLKLSNIDKEHYINQTHFVFKKYFTIEKSTRRFLDAIKS